MKLDDLALWEELCACWDDYWLREQNYNFNRWTFCAAHPLAHPSTPALRSKLMAHFEAREPHVIRVHNIVTRARLMGIEVRDWPPFEAP